MLVNYNQCKKDFRNTVLLSEDGKEYRGLFVDLRVDHKTIPDKYFVYDCRHGDDGNWCTPVTIEPRVVVNHCGTLLMEAPIKWPNEDDKYIPVKEFWYEE